MGRTLLVAAGAFAAGLAVSSFSRTVNAGSSPREDSRAVDLAAIDKLHKADIDATLSNDLSALPNLWSDDAVNLQFPGPAVVGKQSMREAYAKFQSQSPDFKVLRYAPNMQDIQITSDGWAIEWGYADATYRMSSAESPVATRVKVLRVLKRQNDGSWKFARIASNN